MRQKTCLTAIDAQACRAACLAHAESFGWAVTIAIVDEGGYVLLVERMDGAGLLTPETAIGKARTATLSRNSSKALEDRIVQRPSFLNLPQYIPVQGGLPIWFGNECIGGIGVSGVQSDFDEQIAQAGLTALAHLAGQNATAI
jgi:glc operon protein GlcG